MDIQKLENINHMISINENTIPEPKTNVKKRKSSNNLFKIALFMMRGHSRKSKMLHVDNESRSVWRRLVGSMRPMHLQSNQSPPQKIDKEDNQKMVIITENASNENDNIQSEDGSDSASEFPSPTSSRYASAVGLSEMANLSSQASSRYASAVGLSEMVVEEEAEEKEKENEGNGEGEGDDMIDAKADEFIAQFYKQMKLQRMDIVDRHYEEISNRSLGL